MTPAASVGLPASLAVACWCAGVGLLVLPPPASSRRRRREGPRPLPVGWRRRIVAGSGGLAVGVLFGLPWWGTVLAAAVIMALVARLPAGRPRAVVERELDLVIAHADLLAGCLESGLPLVTAVPAVQAELEGRMGREMATAGAPRASRPGRDRPRRGRPAGPASGLDAWAAVAALLAVGVDAEAAWRPADPFPDLAPVAAAARRSAVAGTPLAPAVREHAAALRATRSALRSRQASRAGVLMTAPLGLCFLPAFLCLGLAPVVLGLLRTLHIF